MYCIYIHLEHIVNAMTHTTELRLDDWRMLNARP